MSTGLPLVVSAPSGAGKSTLCRALLEKRPGMHYAVSCTTRRPRPGETDGKDYYFIGEPEFQEKIARGEFLEWAKVYDHHYGTPLEHILAPLREGRDVLLDLDTQGAMAVKAKIPDAVCVFICPPDWASLERRLRGRGQDDEQAMARRLAGVQKEIASLKFYDYLVVNANAKEKEAVEDLLAILRAEHRRIGRVSRELEELEAGLLRRTT
jgi:guanylate kinase